MCGLSSGLAAGRGSARVVDRPESTGTRHDDELAELFRGVGLADVVCDAIEIPTRFASFVDYWRPLLGGSGPAAACVASLDDDRRGALARKLDGDLPRDRRGGIVLVARAWAVRGAVS